MSAQGELVSELQTFLDECYFEVLMQVLNEGNPSRLLAREVLQRKPKSLISSSR